MTSTTHPVAARPAPPAAGPAAAAARPRLGPRGVKGLSKLQKATLCQLAAEAWKLQNRLGLAEVPAGMSPSAAFEAWRRGQQQAAIGRSSLREATNDDYRPLRAHFLTLAGREDQAFSTYLRTGRVKDRGPAEDTHERREELRTLILQSLIAHGEKVTPGHARYCSATAAVVAAKGGMLTQGYVVSLAKAKARGRELGSLTAGELAQILYTVRNRIAAREGRGSTRGRNKSQRKTTTTDS
jgi:hypothetical protein